MGELTEQSYIQGEWVFDKIMEREIQLFNAVWPNFNFTYGGITENIDFLFR